MRRTDHWIGPGAVVSMLGERCPQGYVPLLLVVVHRLVNAEGANARDLVHLIAQILWHAGRSCNAEEFGSALQDRAVIARMLKFDHHAESFDDLVHRTIARDHLQDFEA